MLEFNATFFIAMVSFVIFMIIMNAILYKPLERIVRERRDLIDNNNMKSKTALEKLDSLQKWQAASIEKAQKSSRETYQKILNEYKAKKEAMLDSEKNLSKKEIAIAQAQTEGEVIEAKPGLKSEVKTLASIISSKILGYETNI